MQRLSSAFLHIVATSWNKYKRCLRDGEVLSFEMRDQMCLCVLVIYVMRKGMVGYGA